MIPTSYGRKGDNLYIHGSAASRMLRKLNEGVPVCLTVTLLDGWSCTIGFQSLYELSLGSDFGHGKAGG